MLDTDTIIIALEKTNGSVTEAAELLGVPRTTLSRWVNKNEHVRKHRAAILSEDAELKTPPGEDPKPPEIFKQNISGDLPLLQTPEQVKKFLNLDAGYSISAVSYAYSERVKDQKVITSAKFNFEDTTHLQPLFDLSAIRTGNLKHDSYRPIRASRRPMPFRDYESVAVLGDLHAGPGLDRELYEVALRFLKDLRPDGLFLGGDIADFSSLSTYGVSDPRWCSSFCEDIESANEIRRDLRAVIGDDAWFEEFMGNHEERYERWLYNKTLSDMHKHPNFQYRNLMNFDEVGCKLIGSKDGADYPYAEKWFCKRLKAIHGIVVKAGSGNSVRAQVERDAEDTIQFHVHSEANVSVRVGNDINKVKRGYECPAMAKPDLGYMKNPNSSQGLMMLSIFPDESYNAEFARYHADTKSLYFRDQRWRLDS